MEREKIIIGALMTAMVATVLATTVPAAAQKLTRYPAGHEPSTPEAITRKLEAEAVSLRRQGKAAARLAHIDICWPSNAQEYRAFAKFVVVLVTAVSHEDAELPLARVYAHINGKDVVLMRLGGVRSEFPKNSIVRAVAGRYREDSFYLMPASALMGKGVVLADFARNRKGFQLFELPDEDPPDFVRTDPNPNPESGMTPDNHALQVLLKREFPGFQLLKTPH